jgi:hypothetical protein
MCVAIAQSNKTAVKLVFESRIRALLIIFPMLTVVCGSHGVSAATPINQIQPLNPDARVVINNVRGSIKVIGSDKSDLIVSGQLGEGARLETSGNADYYTIKVVNSNTKGWLLWRAAGEDTQLVVNVPRAIGLIIDSVSADVDVSGLVGGRAVSVSTVSAQQRVDVQTKRLVLDSVSGDMSVKGQFDYLKLGTISGAIKSEAASAQMRLDTISGDAKIVLPSIKNLVAESVSGKLDVQLAGLAESDVHLEAVSGAVILEIPQDASTRLSLESFSGKITSAWGSAQSNELGLGSKLEQVLGDGKAQIQIETFNGDIDLKKR